MFAQIDFRQNIRYAILDKAKNVMLRKAASERVLYRMCTKTFTWRLLTGPELTEVYLNEMRRDFPAGELKPLSMILNSEADGTAHTWGVFDGETLAAYLLMVRPAGSRVSQLDYFAVLPEYRSAGLGAQLLAGQQHCAAHQRNQNQQRRQQRCPEGSPTSTAHGTYRLSVFA